MSHCFSATKRWTNVSSFSKKETNILLFFLFFFFMT
jgi:hypothetical protein